MKRRRWDAALDRLPHKTKFRIAEIGVWCGHFSEQILRARAGARIIQVDRWTTYSTSEQANETEARMSKYSQLTFDKAKYENLARIARFPKRVRILEMDQIEAAEKIRDGSLYMVFLDGPHSYEGCRDGIIAYLPKIAKGGWIGGHDFRHNGKGRPGVRKAVTEIFGKNYELDADKTWWVRV
jgi:hypothetical protein